MTYKRLSSIHCNFQPSWLSTQPLQTSVHQTNGFLWIAHKLNPNVQNNTCVPIPSMVAWYIYLHECLIFIGFHAGIFPQVPQLHHLSGPGTGFNTWSQVEPWPIPANKGSKSKGSLDQSAQNKITPIPYHPWLPKKGVFTYMNGGFFFLVVNVAKYTNPMDGMDQQNLDFFVELVSVSVLNLFTPYGSDNCLVFGASIQWFSSDTKVQGFIYMYVYIYIHIHKESQRKVWKWKNGLWNRSPASW